MANTFKNALSASIGTTPVDVYTACAGVTATVIGMSVANRTASAITFDVQATDTSGTVTTYLIKDGAVPVGSSLIVIGGDQKVVLEPTDKITVTSSASSSVDATMSILEQS